MKINRRKVLAASVASLAGIYVPSIAFCKSDAPQKIIWACKISVPGEYFVFTCAVEEIVIHWDKITVIRMRDVFSEENKQVEISLLNGKTMKFWVDKKSFEAIKEVGK